MSLQEKASDSNKLLEKRIRYQKVLGLNLPNFPTKNCMEALTLQPQAGDIFLVTYPKAGTTWAQYIIWSILNKGSDMPEYKKMLGSLIPYLELTGTKILEKMPTPRIMKTHLPFTHNPYHPEAKYIYIARNIKDQCVSSYHFFRELSVLHGYGMETFDEFVDYQISGELSYGTWYDHVISWYDHKDDHNVLILTYEWMKLNHAEAVKKMSRILGKEYEEELEKDPPLLKKIVENTSFQSMKKNIPVQLPKVINAPSDDDLVTSALRDPQNQDDESNFGVINFFRKGESGDWIRHLSDFQERKLNEHLLSQPRIKEIMTLWKGLWTMDDLITSI